jgi:hypothetical protein
MGSAGGKSLPVLMSHFSPIEAIRRSAFDRRQRNTAGDATPYHHAKATSEYGSKPSVCRTVSIATASLIRGDRAIISAATL